MGFTVPQKILLIGLLLYGTGAVAQAVNPTTLMNIVNNFENEFYLLGQYAVVFRVTRANCQDPNYGGQELITQELIDKLQRNQVYRSHNLIAARKTTRNHSEYRLKNLLNNILNLADGCVIYFTANSPCMNRCLSDRPEVNIIRNLQDLQNYNGIKAFAFRRIWKDDWQRREEMVRRLKEIAPNLPYYWCLRNRARCNRL